MFVAMPSRAPRAVLLGCLLSVAVAAPASAATVNVSPDGADSSCARDGSPCRTLTRAVSLAEDGDTIRLAKGGYVEPPVVVDKADITIGGAGPGTVIAAADGSGDTISFTSGAGTMHDLVVAQGQGAHSALSAASRLTLDRVTVVSGVAGAPAALEMRGPGDLDRVTVLHTAGTALSVVSPATGDGQPNAVTADSSIFASPSGSHGIAVTSPASGNPVTPSTADDVTLALRHATVSGPEGSKGILLDASDANGCTPPNPACLLGPAVPRANMTATLTDSIVDGESVAVANGPDDAGADNTARIVFTGKNLADAVTGSSEGAPSGSVNAAALFYNAANYVLVLRADAAAAIDQGGANPGDGEPDTDVFGDPRKSGAATDLGADEFVNLAPTASFGVSEERPAPGEEVTFTSTSKDPETGFGGGIVTYYWDFGDGTPVRETTEPVVKHTYATEGDKKVRLAVVDNFGAGGGPAVRDVLVEKPADTAAPAVEILQPKQRQKLRLRRKGGKRRALHLTVLGGVTDATGIKQVDVALRLVKRRGGKRLRGGTCEFYGGRRRFSRTDCDDPVWLKASRTRNVWRFRTHKRLRLPKGLYELRVRGTDMLGNVTSEFTKADRTLVRFRVR